MVLLEGVSGKLHSCLLKLKKHFVLIVNTLFVAMAADLGLADEAAAIVVEVMVVLHLILAAEEVGILDLVVGVTEVDVVVGK